MSERCWELVASDEPAILTKPLLDTIVMEDGQSDGRLANPASTDERDWGGTFCKGDDLLDQIVTSETNSRRRGR